MKRTSPNQFEMMVTFMEQYGDICKPSNTSRGRISNIQLWERLEALLNNDCTGDSRTAEKWKKVWSDLKNNTKKKAARINRAATGTGGGPAVHAKLTDLEERVLSIIGYTSATGLGDVQEAGFEIQGPPLSEAVPVYVCTEEEEVILPNLDNEDNVDVAPSPQGVEPRTATSTVNVATEGAQHTTPSPAGQTPTRRVRSRRKRPHVGHEAFLQNDNEWREFRMEQHRENLRLREMELQTQTQWQTIASRFVDIIEKYLNK